MFVMSPWRQGKISKVNAPVHVLGHCLVHVLIHVLCKVYIFLPLGGKWVPEWLPPLGGCVCFSLSLFWHVAVKCVCVIVCVLVCERETERESARARVCVRGICYICTCTCERRSARVSHMDIPCDACMRERESARVCS
jgi:hypothetical protein